MQYSGPEAMSLGCSRDFSVYRRFLHGALMVLLLAVTVAGCSRPDTLATLQAEGVLHVITRNAPSIYYEDREGPTGFDHELAQRFADHLGVELRVRTADSNGEILRVLDEGYAHIGFTGLSADHDWGDRFRSLGNGLTSESVIIYHRGLAHPDDLGDILEQAVTVHAAAETNHLPHLQALQSAN